MSLTTNQVGGWELLHTQSFPVVGSLFGGLLATHLDPKGVRDVI